MLALRCRWIVGSLASLGLGAAVQATAWSQDSVAAISRALPDRLFDIRQSQRSSPGLESSLGGLGAKILAPVGPVHAG